MSVCMLVLHQMVYAHIRKGDGEWYSCKTKYTRICESLTTFFLISLHFYCQTSLNLWFFDFLFCCGKKYLLCFYPMFSDMHIPPIFDPSMNFGLQLSSYKFRTISSKATSIDYNHPNFSSDPTNIHDCGFRFHICKFLIFCW